MAGGWPGMQRSSGDNPHRHGLSPSVRRHPTHWAGGRSTPRPRRGMSSDGPVALRIPHTAFAQGGGGDAS